MFARLNPIPGLLHGHTAIQIPQPWCSLKKGKHISKSTYHLFVPLTVFFSLNMAPGGHSFSHILQFKQKSSTSYDCLFVYGKGQSVKIAESLKLDPNSGLIIDPCFPNSPNPASRKGLQGCS